MGGGGGRQGTERGGERQPRARPVGSDGSSAFRGRTQVVARRCNLRCARQRGGWPAGSARRACMRAVAKRGDGQACQALY
eukprot:349687-Chlamydomonas_euryale.AAC.3